MVADVADDPYNRLIQIQDKIIDRHEAAFKEVLVDCNSIKTEIALMRQRLDSLESKVNFIAELQRKDENIKAKITGMILVGSLIIGFIVQTLKDKFFP